jgi:cytidine deaminase
VIDDTDRELYQRTLDISKRAYAPYTNFHVGVVLRARDGTLFDGVNVENAAYPLGVCGEKTAYVTAVTQGYKPGDFDLIVINASPCGGCRQWLAEMQVERVVFRNGGRLVQMTVDELLPEQFDAGDMA